MINISPVGIKNRWKVIKTLVMLIICGLGPPKLLTFPLWESKISQKVIKTLVVLIIGGGTPQIINITPVGIKHRSKSD